MQVLRTTLFCLLTGALYFSSYAQIQYRVDSTVYEQNKNGQWSPYLVHSNAHNGGDHILAKKRVKIDTNGNRQNFEQDLYTFNAQSGELEKKESQSWSAQFSNWVPTRTYEYSYANSKLVAKNTLLWKSADSTWLMTDIDSFFYDSNGDQTLFLNYGWNNVTFTLAYALETSYKSAGVRDTLKTWSGAFTKISFYEVYFQDAAGKDTAVVKYRITNGKTAFEAKKRILRNSNGVAVRLEEWRDYLKPGTPNPVSIYDYEVNESVNRSAVLYDTDVLEYEYAEKAITRIILNIERGGVWGPYTRGTNYYDTKFPNSLSNPGTAAIRIYPNPCNDLIHLDLSKFPEASTIHIFDLYGKQVANQNLSESNTVEVANLNNGVFMLQLLDLNGKVVGSSKFLKK